MIRFFILNASWSVMVVFYFHVPVQIHIDLTVNLVSKLARQRLKFCLFFVENLLHFFRFFALDILYLFEILSISTFLVELVDFFPALQTLGNLSLYIVHHGCMLLVPLENVLPGFFIFFFD